MQPKIIVSSPSFSKNQILVQELKQSFQNVILNLEGKRYSGRDLIDYIKDADALIVGLEEINQAVLDECSHLNIIAKYGVGLDNIDLQACENKKIKIGWTGGVNRLSVAEMTIGFMLALCRNLFTTSLLHKNGKWEKSGGYQLTGKTVGVIGVGNIGKEVVRLLQPFHCRVLANDLLEMPDFFRQYNLERATKEQIFIDCDVVTVHTPLTEQTAGLINKDTLGCMKQGAFVINTARGGIVVQDDLKRALITGTISGAAIDVYDCEPPTDKEFLGLPNLICTPHIGGNSAEAVLAMGRSAIAHLKNYFGV